MALLTISSRPIKRIFVTGIPGSKWSGIAQCMEKLPGFNLTDRSNERMYLHDKYSGHIGAYFGEGMEFEPILSEDNLNRPYTDPDAGIMLAKSHDWATQLDFVYSYAKANDAAILLVWRPVPDSVKWWYKAGGWDITYPNYSAYKDDRTFLDKCIEQNRGILEFSIKHNLVFEPFDSIFVNKYFDFEGSIEFDESVKVCLIS